MRQSPFSIHKKLILIIALTISITGCGGSGGGEAGTPTDPVDPPIPTFNMTLSVSGPKTINLQWDAVAQVDHYRVRVDPFGTASYVILQGADNIAATEHAFEIPVHLTDWHNCSYFIEAIDSQNQLIGQSNAEYLQQPLSSSAICYVKAANANTSDLFGENVAISGDGNTIAVGAISEDSSATGVNGNDADNSASNAGAVYVFVHTGTGQWSQQAYIKASNTEAGDNFGSAVSLSLDGNTLAVGARSEDSSATGINGNQADNTASNAGAVYIFTRSGTTWTQQAYIKASNTDSADTFGYPVDLSDDGNTLAVGATGEDSSATGVNGNQTINTEYQSGAAYVFTRSGTTWTQHSYIKASNTETNDAFGRLDLSGDGLTLAVGTISEKSSATGINGDDTDNSLNRAGAVYIFSLSLGSWAQEAYVKASNTNAYDSFASSFALSRDGNTLAVSATGDSSSSPGIGGDQNDNSLDSSGAVYLFRRSSGWSQEAYIKASNPGLEWSFGSSLDLSADGNTLAVGCYSEESDSTGVAGDQTDDDYPSGAAYVFQFDSGLWSQTNYIKASNTGSSDAFGGRSLAISSDGKTLAIGAYYEDSSATGINGDQTSNAANDAGAVYIY